MKTTNYTDLRNNLKGYFDGVVSHCEPLIVHRPANTSVVIISLSEYNAMKETEYISSSPEMMSRIRTAENEIRNGMGKTVNVEDLWN